MAQTILHIGSDKTGTTAIQRALSCHREELAARRVWYPDLDGRPDHRLLAAEPRRLPDVPDGLDTVVLSSEALWPLTAARIAELLAGLPPGPVTVLAYVRAPVDHAEAAFGQRLRLSRSVLELRALHAARRVPAVVNPIVGRARRRLTQLEGWVEAVDRSRRPDLRLVIRPYDPAGDVVVDLCRAVGLDQLVPLLGDRPDPRPNAGVDLVALHASVLVRVAAGPSAQVRFLDALAGRHLADGPHHPPSPVPLLPPGLRRRIRAGTDPVLARLDRVVGGLDPVREPESKRLLAAPSGLDGRRARALLQEVWPTFPAGAPEPSS